MMNSARTCLLFILLLHLSHVARPQCDGSFEFESYLYPKGNSFFGKVISNNNDGQVFALFFNDSLKKEEKVFIAEQEGPFTTTGLLLYKEKNGELLWEQLYEITVFHQAQFLESNQVLIEKDGVLNLFVQLDSGSYQLNETTLINIDKSQLLALRFDSNDGSFLGIKPVLSDGQRWGGLSLGKWQMAVKKNALLFYFVPYSDLLINENTWIRISDEFDEVVELTTTFDGDYLRHRTMLRSDYCQSDRVTIREGKVYLVGRFTGSIWTNDTAKIYSNSTIGASDVFLASFDTLGEDIQLSNVTGSVGGEECLGLLAHAKGIGVLFDSESSELQLPDTLINTGVDEFILLNLDTSHHFKGNCRIKVVNTSGFTEVTLFKSNEGLPAINVSSNSDFFVNGELINRRTQSSQGITTAHLYLNEGMTVVKRNMFWSDKVFIIEPLWEEDGITFYRGIQFEDIQGSLNINWAERKKRVFVMQKCIDNVMGIQDQTFATSKLSAYPNPFSERLFANSSLPKELMIRNAWGVLMFQGVIPEGGLNTSNWSAGLYIVHDESGNTRKLIKAE
jgi:hypothetical protein